MGALIKPFFFKSRYTVDSATDKPVVGDPSSQLPAAPLWRLSGRRQDCGLL